MAPAPYRGPRGLAIDTSTTPHAYAEAVAALAEHAYEATAEGEACARILLSAYDSWQWGFTAADLARMDARALEAALTVLCGRAQLGAPPQGAAATDATSPESFEALARHWRPERPRPTGSPGGRG